MSMVEVVEQRMRDAEDFFLRELRAAQARALALPVEEVMRRNNEALGELLSDDSGKYSWH